MRLHSLERHIRHGCLNIHLPDGYTIRLGQGRPVGHMHLCSRRVLFKLLRNPDIQVGETYVNGDWTAGEGGLLPLFHLYSLNSGLYAQGPVRRWLKWLLHYMTEANSRLRARRNVQHHYDLDAELFRRFLDADLQYSCAYFERPGMTLEAAQQAKCRHIANKLLLHPGDRVLDIGSGWGGLALYLAEHLDVYVTGLTLSRDQYNESQRRARERGLEQRVQFMLQDYREHSASYDAVVSVGMFEHVGRPQYPVFFEQLMRLLKPEGRSLIHTIGRSGPPCDSQGWIQRRIFPGGYIPALSEVAAPIEISGLVLSDLEVWRLHYAETLRHWNQRFQTSRPFFRERLGEQFCRMWEFYLQGCEAMFRWDELVVLQLQLARVNDAVPTTRDYLYAADAGARQASSAPPYWRDAG